MLKLKKAFGILATVTITSISSVEANERTCSITDFQACKSCEELNEAIDVERPNYGDYYRGAHWNALFSAYRHDCRAIGIKLLNLGASPVSGGSGGSMIYTIANKWPHRNIEINFAWAKLLKQHNASKGDKLLSQPTTDTFDVLDEWPPADYQQIIDIFD